MAEVSLLPRSLLPRVRSCRLGSHRGGGRGYRRRGLVWTCSFGLGGASLGQRLETAAQLSCVAAEVLQPRKRSEAFQAEDPLEERCDPIANRTQVAPAGLGDQAPLDEACDDRV